MQLPDFRRSVLVIALLCGGCKTPLQKAINTLAPDYDAKEPANADSNLGGRWVGHWYGGGSIASNACYVGNLQEDAAGLSKVELSYDDAAEGDIKTDFGPSLKAEASGNYKRKVSVILTDLKETEAKNVLFDPVGTCFSDPTLRPRYLSGDVTDEVVTRAMKAASISIVDAGSAAGKVTVNTNSEASGRKVSGSVSGSTASTTTWSGTDLYVAMHKETFRVTTTKADCLSVAISNPGSACTLEPCRLIVTAANAATWSGTLSCENGSSVGVSAALGMWTGAVKSNAGGSLPPGVSYGVLVTPGQAVGTTTVSLVRWNTLSLGK